MALADYRLCDVCEGKTFYDANLDYDFHDKERPKTGLSGVGDWVVLCETCAETHEARVAKKSDEDPEALLRARTEKVIQLGLDKEREELRAKELKRRLDVAVKELTEARDHFRNTHKQLCDEAYTSRGRHAPECMDYWADALDMTLADLTRKF